MGLELRDAVCYLIDKDGKPLEVSPASIEDFSFEFPPEAEAELNERRFALMDYSEVRIECKYDHAFARLIERINKEFATYRRLRHIAAHTKKRRIRKKALKRITELEWRNENEQRK